MKKPDLKLIKILVSVLLVFLLVIIIYANIDFLSINQEVFSNDLTHGIGVYFFKYENKLTELNVYVRVFGKQIQYNNTGYSFLIDAWDYYYQAK